LFDLPCLMFMYIQHIYTLIILVGGQECAVLYVR
jgi:hypothetical protein